MPLYVYEPDTKPDVEHALEQNRDGHPQGPSPCCSFEYLQSLSEPALTQCPTCGHPVRRALTSAGFSMRSSGTMPGAKETKPLFGSNQGRGKGSSQDTGSPGDSRAGRVARLAANHVCGLGCRH